MSAIRFAPLTWTSVTLTDWLARLLACLLTRRTGASAWRQYPAQDSWPTRNGLGPERLIHIGHFRPERLLEAPLIDKSMIDDDGLDVHKLI